MSLVFPSYDENFDYYQYNLDYDLKNLNTDFHSHDKSYIMDVHKALHEIRIEKGFHRLEYLEFCSNLKNEFQKRRRADVVSQFFKVNSNKNQRMYAFITVGWNEQTVTPQKMLTASLNILKLKYFSTAYMVLEKNRLNGTHHHTHYLVEFSEKYYQSSIIGWIYQTAGVGDICLKKEFIDYKGPQQSDKKKPYQSYEHYFEYIHGNKCEEKLPFVALDKIWRLENKFEDIYSR